MIKKGLKRFALSLLFIKIGGFLPFTFKCEY